MLVAAAAELVVERGHGVFAPVANQPPVDLQEVGRQRVFTLLQLRLQALEVGPDERLLPLDLPGGLVGLGAGGGQVRFGLLDLHLQLVDLLHRFEDFVLQHAVGHLHGADLVLQCLVFGVALGLVELSLVLLDPLFAGFQLELLLVGGNPRRFGLGQGLAQLLLEALDVGLAGKDHPGTVREALFEIAQLPVDPVQGPQHFDGYAGVGCHLRIKLEGNGWRNKKSRWSVDQRLGDSRQPAMRSRNPANCPLRTGCWSLRTALASICRTRSRVTLKIRPTSSRV